MHERNGRLELRHLNDGKLRMLHSRLFEPTRKRWISERVNTHLPVHDKAAQTMFAVFDKILSVQPTISVSIKLVEAAEHDVEVLIREVFRHLRM